MASLAESRESAQEVLEEEAVRSGESDEGAESCPASCIAEEEGTETPAPATDGEDGEEDESDDEDEDEEEEEEDEDPWEALEARCEDCKNCSLWRTRTNVVVGDGDREASLMFVGEAPGESEDIQGIPFVGRAGQLLNQYLEAVGIERDNVYICNILKCRPPKNRDPLPEEENSCIHFLREQVRLVKPKIIVCLGRISAARLIHEDFKITKEHGVFIQRGRFLMCAVYHPAALLRDPGKRREMYVDMKEIKRQLDLLSQEKGSS